MPHLVALDLPWSEVFVRALEDAWAAGDAVAPLDPRLPPEAARRLVSALRPTQVVAPDGERVSLDDGLPTEPGDALVVATSGSRGAPKAVVLTHAAVVASAHSTTAALEVDPARDKWLACIPLSHMGGLGVVTRSIISGTPLVVHPRFDPVDAQREAANGVTLISLVTAALTQVDGSMFRKILLGGAAPPTRLADNVVTTYGLTETCGGVVYDGVPLEGVEVAVGDDDGSPSAGEVLVRGPMMLRAYRDGTDPKLPGGWLPTGDAGRIDGKGRLHVAGRIEETINTGGEKVWPQTVEEALIDHPMISEVAVIGRPDEVWGQRVVAFVVPKNPAEPVRLEELRAWTEEKLPNWAAPREVVLLETLPRTPSGKVTRRMLR